MQDNRVIPDQLPASFVIPPNAFSTRISGGPAEDLTKNFQRFINPSVLVDFSDSISFNTRDEQHYQDPLASYSLQ